MCARHDRGAIEICLSEKRALAKKDWETLFYAIENWLLSHITCGKKTPESIFKITRSQ